MQQACPSFQSNSNYIHSWGLYWIWHTNCNSQELFHYSKQFELTFARPPPAKVQPLPLPPPYLLQGQYRRAPSAECVDQFTVHQEWERNWELVKYLVRYSSDWLSGLPVYSSYILSVLLPAPHLVHPLYTFHLAPLVWPHPPDPTHLVLMFHSWSVPWRLPRTILLR